MHSYWKYIYTSWSNKLITHHIIYSVFITHHIALCFEHAWIFLCVCRCVQWKYDKTTATYLLLLAKKQRGRPIRLRGEIPALDPSCSPLQGIQVIFKKPLFWRGAPPFQMFCIIKSLRRKQSPTEWCETESNLVYNSSDGNQTSTFRVQLNSQTAVTWNGVKWCRTIAFGLKLIFKIQSCQRGLWEALRHNSPLRKNMFISVLPSTSHTNLRRRMQFHWLYLCCRRWDADFHSPPL